LEGGSCEPPLLFWGEETLRVFRLIRIWVVNGWDALAFGSCFVGWLVLPFPGSGVLNGGVDFEFHANRANLSSNSGAFSSIA
jgi:hypothetical protein